MEPNILDKIIGDRELRAHVARDSHKYFFGMYFPHYIKYRMAPFHEEMFHITEDQHNPLSVIVAFRGSGKSTIMTFSYPIWSIIGKLQKKFVLIICKTQAQARQHLSNIKQELESNTLLKTDLGPFEEPDDEWRNVSLVIPKYNARIMVVSADQSIRGIRHNEHRPDLIIGDDVEDVASAKTYEQREKLERWFASEIVPVGDFGTKIVFVGNVVNEDGLMFRLRDRIQSGDIHGSYHAFPIIENGRPTWVGKFPSIRHVQDLKKKVGHLESWMREYELKVIAQHDQVVPKKWIHYYNNDLLPKSFDRIVTGIDLAVSEKEKADYTAIISLGVKYGENDTDTKIYVLPNIIHARMNAPTALNEIEKRYHLCRKGLSSNPFILENNGAFLSYQQLLKERGCHHIEGVTSRSDKRTRLSGVASLIQNGTVLFPREGSKALVREIVGLGREKHDDLCDAFTMALSHVIEKHLNKPFYGVLWI